MHAIRMKKWIYLWPRCVLQTFPSSLHEAEVGTFRLPPIHWSRISWQDHFDCRMHSCSSALLSFWSWAVIEVSLPLEGVLRAWKSSRKLLTRERACLEEIGTDEVACRRAGGWAMSSMFYNLLAGVRWTLVIYFRLCVVDDPWKTVLVSPSANNLSHFALIEFEKCRGFN